MCSRAERMPAKAASTAVSTGTTKVITVRLCDSSDETSKRCTPFTAAIASRIFATISGRRPSEKFGTHSTSFMGPGNGERGTGKLQLREQGREQGSLFPFPLSQYVEQPPVHRRAPAHDWPMRHRRGLA